jgi:hypothetical protein
VVLLNVIVQGGGSNLFLPDQLKDFTEADIKERVKGSKLVIVSEQVCRIRHRDLTLAWSTLIRDLTGYAECDLHDQGMRAAHV